MEVSASMERGVLRFTVKSYVNFATSQHHSYDHPSLPPTPPSYNPLG